MNYTSYLGVVDDEEAENEDDTSTDKTDDVARREYPNHDAHKQQSH